MEAVTIPVEPIYSEEFDKIKEVVAQTPDLENLIFKLMLTWANHISLKLIRIQADGEDVLMIQASKKSRGYQLKSEKELKGSYFIRVDVQPYLRMHEKYHPKHIVKVLDDIKKPIENSEWLDARDAELGVQRYWKYGGTCYSEIRPTACIKMVLGYALAELATVQIDQEIFESQRVAVLDGIRFIFSYCPPKLESASLREEFWTSVERVQRLIENRELARAEKSKKAKAAEQLEKIVPGRQLH